MEKTSKEAGKTSVPAPRRRRCRIIRNKTIREALSSGGSRGRRHVKDPNIKAWDVFKRNLLTAHEEERNLLGVIRRDGRQGGQTWESPPAGSQNAVLQFLLQLTDSTPLFPVNELTGDGVGTHPGSVSVRRANLPHRVAFMEAAAPSSTTQKLQY